MDLDQLKTAVIRLFQHLDEKNLMGEDIEAYGLNPDTYHQGVEILLAEQKV